MKIQLGHKSLALLVILVAGMIMVSFMQGQKSAGQPAVVTNPALQGVAATTTVQPAATPTSSMSVMGRKFGLENARFVHFRIGSRNVKDIFDDGRYIWIASSGGVIRYDTATDQHMVFNNKEDGLLSNGIFHVSKIKGQIVVGTYGGGLSLYNEAENSWSNINIPDGLADQFVYDVVELENGDVWIATWSGINRVRNGEFKNPDAWQLFTVENTAGGLPNPWVYALAAGKNGEMWFATENGLARLQDGKWDNWQHKDGLGAPYELVKDTIQSTNDPGKASSHHARLKKEQGLEDVNVAYNPNYIISLFVDDDGVVWCGTWGGGLSRFDGKTWKTYTTHDGLAANHIFMLYADNDQQIWIGTNRGLSRYNREDDSFVSMTTEDGLFANNVFSMVRDSKGEFWIGSFGGIAHISKK